MPFGGFYVPKKQRKSTPWKVLVVLPLICLWTCFFLLLRPSAAITLQQLASWRHLTRLRALHTPLVFRFFGRIESGDVVGGNALCFLLRITIMMVCRCLTLVIGIHHCHSCCFLIGCFFCLRGHFPFASSQSLRSVDGCKVVLFWLGVFFWLSFEFRESKVSSFGKHPWAVRSKSQTTT